MKQNQTFGGVKNKNPALNHVTLTISNTKRSRAFYADLLGFDITVIEENPDNIQLEYWLPKFVSKSEATSEFGGLLSCGRFSLLRFHGPLAHTRCMTTYMNIHAKYPSMDDARLAQQARVEPQAFAELYRRHVASVYRYHRAHTNNDKDAEDLTSQTFMAALEGIRSYRGTGPYIAWLMGIATRLRAHHFRGSRPEVPLDAALHIPTPGPPTDKAAARRIQMEHVLDALRTLSQDRAEALILCFISELSTAEAGLVLGKSDAAVRMLISRGLQDLRTRTSLALDVDYE